MLSHYTPLSSHLACVRCRSQVEEGGAELAVLEHTASGKYSVAYGWLLARFNRVTCEL